MIMITIDDLPNYEPNCLTCTRKGAGCARRETKRFPNGYVYSPVTGQISGMIAGCIHYTGKYGRFRDADKV